MSLPLKELFSMYTDGEMQSLHVATSKMVSENQPHLKILIWLNLMSRADALWDVSYDYPRIRGMCWLAKYTLKEMHNESKSDESISTALVYYSESYLHYTETENAFVSNNPKMLAYHSEKAITELNKCLLSIEEEEEEVFSFITEMAETKKIYFNGLHLFAITLEQLLDEVLPHDAFTDRLAELDKLLQDLEEAEDETLHSELHSHRAFLKYHSELVYSNSKPPELYCNATIIYGACSYVTNEILQQVNADIVNKNNTDISKWLDDDIDDKISTEALQDIFETSLGKENMGSSLIELDEWTLHYYGKQYAVSPTIKISNLGIISMEFSIDVENVSEMEIQSLVDLIAPHAPQAIIYPSSIEIDQLPEIYHPFLVSEMILYSWNSTIDFLTDYKAEILKETKQLASNPDINVGLESIFTKTESFHQRLDDILRGTTEYVAAKQLVDNTENYFREIIDNHVESIMKGLHEKFTFNKFNTSWDTERDWYSVVKFTSIYQDEDHGYLTFPELLSNDRFHWMLAPSRESKASIADWIKVAHRVSESENLATIRSHLTDFMIVRGKQAYLYFPDNPYYLIDYEYMETLRLMFWIRTLINAFTELGVIYHKRAHYLRNAFLKVKSHPKLQHIMQDENQLAEYFKLEADEKLNLLQECLISRYEDHAKLMRATIEKMGLEPAKEALVARINKVVTTQEFLERQIQYVIERFKEQRTIRHDELKRKHEKFVRTITTIAAGIYGTSWITVDWLRYLLILVIVTPISILLARNWLKKREMEQLLTTTQNDALIEITKIEEELNRQLEWTNDKAN